VLEQMTYKGNIGATDSISFQDLRRELFLSRQLYLPKTDRWWPVNITDRTVNLGRLSAQLRELNIEWSYAWQNSQYTPTGAVLGSEPDPSYTCPIVTLSATSSSIAYSFSHVPGLINRYRLQLTTEADEPVGAEVVHTIPFGNPISGTFSGLMSDTGYKVILYMDVTSTGFTQTCEGGEISTESTIVIDPGDIGDFEFEIISSRSGGLGPRITNCLFDGVDVTLTGGFSYPITVGDGTATGTSATATGELRVYYAHLMDAVISVRDSTGAIQSASRSGNGMVNFSGVISNTSDVVRVEITEA